jgi:site-specific recombinase XerD
MKLYSPLFQTSASAAKAVSVPLADIVRAAEQWVFEGSIRQLSPRTVASRKERLDRFVWFLQHEELGAATTATIKQFLGYVASAHMLPGGRWDAIDTSRNRSAGKPVTAITLVTYHNTLRAFFNWLIAEEMIEVSPMAPIAAPICRPDQIQPFTDDDLTALLKAAQESRNPLRDYSIVLMLLDTGMRASELISIKYGDVDMLGKSAQVVGKGNKKRLVAWSRTCSAALWKHVKHAKLIDTDYVYQSSCGTRVHCALSRDALNQLISRLCRDAGIRRPKHGPHALRHTFAVSFLRQGGNIFTLKERLGHTSLKMTNAYVAFAAADIVRQSMEFSPADALVGKK